MDHTSLSYISISKHAKIKKTTKLRNQFSCALLYHSDSDLKSAMFEAHFLQAPAAQKVSAWSVAVKKNLEHNILHRGRLARSLRGKVAPRSTSLLEIFIIEKWTAAVLPKDPLR